MCLQICRAWRRPGLDLGLDVEQVSGCWAEEAVGTARGLMSPSLPRPALPGRDCSCTPGIPSPSHAVPWDLARGGRGSRTLILRGASPHTGRCETHSASLQALQPACLTAAAPRRGLGAIQSPGLRPS